MVKSADIVMQTPMSTLKPEAKLSSSATAGLRLPWLGLGVRVRDRVRGRVGFVARAGAGARAGARANLAGAGQHEVVGDLLGELVVDGRRGDRPRHGLVAVLVAEGGAEDEAVDEVVHEVAEEDADEHAHAASRVDALDDRHALRGWAGRRRLAGLVHHRAAGGGRAG